MSTCFGASIRLEKYEHWHDRQRWDTMPVLQTCLASISSIVRKVRIAAQVRKRRIESSGCHEAQVEVRKGSKTRTSATSFPVPRSFSLSAFGTSRTVRNILLSRYYYVISSHHIPRGSLSSLAFVHSPWDGFPRLFSSLNCLIS